MAKDVAEALGFKNVSRAYNAHCQDKMTLKKREVSSEMEPTLFPLVTQATITLIPESDLYRLVMRSNLPSTQAFQDWVCDTVLPAILKDGAYVIGEEKGINGK